MCVRVNNNVFSARLLCYVLCMCAWDHEYVYTDCHHTILSGDISDEEETETDGGTGLTKDQGVIHDTQSGSVVTVKNAQVTVHPGESNCIDSSDADDPETPSVMSKNQVS